MHWTAWAAQEDGINGVIYSVLVRLSSFLRRSVGRSVGAEGGTSNPSSVTVRWPLPFIFIFNPSPPSLPTNQPEDIFFPRLHKFCMRNVLFSFDWPVTTLSASHFRISFFVSFSHLKNQKQTNVFIDSVRLLLNAHSAWPSRMAAWSYAKPSRRRRRRCCFYSF